MHFSLEGAEQAGAAAAEHEEPVAAEHEEPVAAEHEEPAAAEHEEPAAAQAGIYLNSQLEITLRIVLNRPESS